MKVVTNAYWVWGDQVSKTPQSGEYLVTGSFMIRGKKNYINPARLELGCTLMFKLDDDSIVNHLNERKNRTTIGSELQMERAKVEEIELDEAVQDQAEEQNDSEGKDDEEDDNIEEIEDIEEIIEEPPTKNIEIVESKPEEDKKQEVGEEENDGEGDNNQEKEERQENYRGNKSETQQKKSDDKKQKDNKGELFGLKTKAKFCLVNINNLPRGKKTKLKRRNKKYADQDDEDRRLAMEAIGAKDMEFHKKNKSKLENEQFK
jgi:hypothetical protein